MKNTLNTDVQGIEMEVLTGLDEDHPFDIAARVVVLLLSFDEDL